MSDRIAPPIADDPPSRLPDSETARAQEGDGGDRDASAAPSSHEFARVAAEFERLRDLTPDRRQAEVDRLHASDPGLVDELVELLRHHDETDALLDAPVIRPGAPTHIGPYRLVRLLGEGGMGTVWLAEQDAPVRRQVALKLIKLGMDTRQVIRRFEAERRVLARMEHPGIARVLDAGVTADGRPYFVMELVRGERITDYADRRRLAPAARLRLFRQVCAAVQHAHGKGVIHRDLKPSNILVTEVDGVPVPKVIDFGVAKVLDEHAADGTRAGDSRDRTRWTAAGQAIGTPDYMSPEQAGIASAREDAGSGQGDVDIRSDVWSLGVVLFELLTGTTPLKARKRTGSGSGSSASERTTTAAMSAPRPSAIVAPRRSGTATHAQRDLAHRRGLEPAALRRMLRAELDWIVLRALEIDPLRRYGTVAALTDDVDRFLENRPISARPSAALYEARKFARRHLLAIGAAALILLSLMAGLATALYGLDRAREQRDAAIDAQGRADDLAERLREELATNMVERGRLAGYADNIALASTLLWDAHLQHPESSHARWALRELLMRHPLRMSVDYPDGTPYEGVILPGESHGDRTGGLLVVGSGIPPIVLDPDTGATLRRFEGSTGEVRNVDLSPDGRLAVTADREGFVRLWSIVDGRETAVLLSRDDGLVVANFLDDATVIAADAGGNLHRIPIDDPVRATHVDTGLGAIEQLATHRPSGRIAVGARDGAIMVYDTSDAAPRRLDGHRGIVMALRFSPDGAELASGATDRVVHLWNADDGSIRHTLDLRNGSIRDLRYADEGRTLHVLGWWRLDAVDTTTLDVREVIAEGGWRLTPHPDGDRVTIVGRNRSHLRGWQLDRRTLLTEFALPSDWSVRIVDAPCGSATVGYADSRAGGHDDLGAWRWLVELDSVAVASLAVAKCGDRVAIGGADGRVRIVDLDPPGPNGFRATRVVREIDDYQPGANRALAFVDRDRLVVPGRGNAVDLVDLVDLVGPAGVVGGSRRRLLDDATGQIPGVPISADRPTVAPTIRPMRNDRLREILMCVASPDGRHLAVAQRGSFVHLIDLTTGHVRTTEVETSNFSLAFTHDSRHLIAGGWTGIVSIFDVGSFERRHSQEHSSLVTSIAMHPTDADLFASVASDGTVRLWSIRECRNLFSHQPLPSTPLGAVGFDPSGTTIRVAGQGGLVVAWPVDLADAFIAGNLNFERGEFEGGRRR